MTRNCFYAVVLEKNGVKQANVFEFKIEGPMDAQLLLNGVRKYSQQLGNLRVASMEDEEARGHIGIFRYGAKSSSCCRISIFRKCRKTL